MKKVFMILAAVAMISVVSCQKPGATDGNKQDDPQSQTDDPQTDDPNKPSGVEPDVSTEAYIEQTAKALMDALDKKNWQADAEFVHDVVKALSSKDYNYEALQQWSEELIDMWKQDPVKDGNATYYRTIIKLSDAKGHFEEQADGSFSRTDASDLQITINVNGEKVTATFACTDSKTVIRVANHESYSGPSAPGETYSESYDVYSEYVYVPQTATLKILRGSAEFASLVLNAQSSIKDPERIDPTTDSFAVDVNLKVGAYTVAVNKLSYTSTKAIVDVKILKDNASLVTVTADADYVVDMNAQQPLPFTSGKVNAVIDVMGMIQFKGNLPDFAAFMNAGESMSESMREGNEAVIKAKIAALEKTFSVKMYFNGTNTERASLGLEPFHYTDPYGNYEYWNCQPVLRFPDGTSVGIEDYFNEKRFGNLMETTENWWNDIQRYINYLFGDI